LNSLSFLLWLIIHLLQTTIEIENEYKTMKGTEGIDLHLPRTTEAKVCLVVSAEVPLRFELDKSIVTTMEGVTDSHSVRIGMAER
jgi:hypothetical protein